MTVDVKKTTVLGAAQRPQLDMRAPKITRQTCNVLTSIRQMWQRTRRQQKYSLVEGASKTKKKKKKETAKERKKNLHQTDLKPAVDAADLGVKVGVAEADPLELVLGGLERHVLHHLEHRVYRRQGHIRPLRVVDERARSIQFARK